MKEVSERTSRLTRQSSGNRQSGRSSSGRSSRRSLSTSEQRSSAANEQVTNARKRKCEAEDTIATKRSNASTHDAVPKVTHKIIGGKKIDAYCWVCHKPAQDDEVYCLVNDCPRVYHKNCHKKIKTNPGEPLCECSWASIDAAKLDPPIRRLELKESLEAALDKVLKEKNNKKGQSGKQYSTLNTWPSMPENNLLHSIMDINTLIDRIDFGYYEDTGKCFQDLKWIYHNCCISKGPSHEMSIIAHKFEKSVKQQLADLEACVDCYLYKIPEYPQMDFFTIFCGINHPIVWAKLKGFPFWPAKCLRIVNGHADVRFFGTHDKSLVPLAQVYKISRRNPGGNPKKPRNSSRMTSYEEAMAELSVYIRNFESHYGFFQYYNDKTPLEETVKKSGKKTRQSKNRNQLDTSSNTDRNGCSGSSNNQSPQLNISLLHDDLSDTKTIFHTPSVSLDNKLDKHNENLAESAAESGIYYQLLFNEESAGDTNIVDEVVESASHMHTQLPEICNESSVTSVKSYPQFASSSSQVSMNNTEIAQTNSDSNIISDNLLSVPSTSSSPPLLITSTHSLRGTFSDTMNGMSKINAANNDLFSDEHIKSLMENVSDDEVEIIKDTGGTPLIDSVLNSKTLTRTFCELLMGSRPNLRNYLVSFQKMALRAYLTMWLEANNSKLDTDELRAYNVMYDKVVKKIAVLKFHMNKLKEENHVLREKLEVKENKSSITEKIIQGHHQRNIESIITHKKQIKMLKKELEEKKCDCERHLKELDTTKLKYNISITKHQNELDNLVLKLKEKDEKLAEEQKKNDDLTKENMLMQETMRRFKELEEIEIKFKKEKEKFEEKEKQFEKEIEERDREMEKYKTYALAMEKKIKSQADDTSEGNLYNISAADQFKQTTNTHHQESEFYQKTTIRFPVINDMVSTVFIQNPSLCVTPSVNASSFTSPSVIQDTSSFSSPSVIQDTSSYPLPSVNTSSYISKSTSSSSNSNVRYEQSPSSKDLEIISEVDKEVKKRVTKTYTRKRK